VSVFALVSAGAALYQRELTAAFDEMRAIESLPAAPAQVTLDVPRAGESLIGMLQIPRLAVSTPIVAGDDRATLEIAAGHLTDTPRPWELGNSAIAAHRDGLFRPLQHIRIGDQVIVRTTRGDLEYRVRDTKIVEPDDLSVLAPADAHTLTLITCYPFGYIGNAPKRFIVHADRVTAPPPQPAVVPVPFASAPVTTVTKAISKPAKAKPKPKPKPKARASLAVTAPAKAAAPKSRNLFKKIAGFFKAKREPAPSRARR
jgi:LPXTG-site transpeptidase (sortase) family protein